MSTAPAEENVQPAKVMDWTEYDIDVDADEGAPPPSAAVGKVSDDAGDGLSAEVEDDDTDDDAGADQAEQPAAESASENDLVARAKRFGFEGDEFADEAQLEKAIAAIDRKILELHERTGQTQPADAKPAGAANTEPAAAPSEATKASDANPDADIDLILDNADEFDPAIQEFAKRAKLAREKDRAEISGLKQTVEQMLAFVQQQQAQQFMQDFDRAFEELGEEYEDLFGKGPTHLLPLDSDERKHRERVAKVMDLFEKEDYEANRPPEGFLPMHRRAVKGAFPDHAEKTIRKSIHTKSQQRRGQAVNRPNQRQAKALTPVDKAAQTAMRFFREKGLSVDDGPDLPDDAF